MRRLTGIPILTPAIATAPAFGDEALDAARSLFPNLAGALYVKALDVAPPRNGGPAAG
jgi:hypothetical protein